jgi:hypothetical protein
MYDIQLIKVFLRDHMGFNLPNSYGAGDFAALVPCWVYWLHPLAETTYAGITNMAISEDDSNCWRMTFMRRLDDMKESSYENQVILGRPQKEIKHARLPDVYGYSTHSQKLRNQFEALKPDSSPARGRLWAVRRPWSLGRAWPLDSGDTFESDQSDDSDLEHISVDMVTHAALARVQSATRQELIDEVADEPANAFIERH